MDIRHAIVLSVCVFLWHWCNGQGIPEDLQRSNNIPLNMFRQESPTNKTMDQLITEAMGGFKDALNLKTINGSILMELDMLLTEQQYSSLYEQPKRSNNPLIRSNRKAIRSQPLYWKNGEIPYRFHPGHFDQTDQYSIRQAMKEWERYTCLRFVAATSSDVNVIVFMDGEGCYSSLGMVGGYQTISLARPGCRHLGLYLHEIGHAIGLVHEHQLPNRDDYVEILWDNVHPVMMNQFTKYTSQTVDQMNVPYDYSSVMHYGVTAFSKDGKLKTIRAKYPHNKASIGEVDKKGLSSTDIEIVNKMYRCRDKSLSTTAKKFAPDKNVSLTTILSTTISTTQTTESSTSLSSSTQIISEACLPSKEEIKIQMWVITVIQSLIFVILILVAVIIVMKRSFSKKKKDNGYEGLGERNVNDTNSQRYMSLDQPPRAP